MLLLFGAVLAAQLPAVQTLLAKKAMKTISGKIDGELIVGSIHASPFDGVVIRDIAIIDDNPAVSPLLSSEDTLFRAKYITATFSLKGLLSKNGVRLKSARLTDALLVITSEPVDDPTLRGTSNIKRVFRLKPADTIKEKSEKEVLHIDHVEVNGMEYRMKNFKKPRDGRKPPIPDAINWRDLDAKDIMVKGRDLSVKGGIISGTVDRMSLSEKSGFSPSLLSGKACVGNGHTQIDDLRIVDVDSDIHMSEFHMHYANTKSFSHFLQDVMIDAQVLPSKVNSRTISYFAKGMKKMDFDADIEGHYIGYVCDFELDQMHFSDRKNGVSGTIDGTLTGLPDSRGMMMNASIDGLNFTLNDLSAFLKGIVPALDLDLRKIAPEQRFNLDATAKGPVNRLSVTARGSSGIGDFSTELDIRNAMDRKRPIQITGNLSTSAFDIGKAIGKDDIGACTMFTRLGATLAKGGPQVTVDTLVVNSLRAHGYTYSDLRGNGRYGSEGFEGNIVSNDPNLTLTAEASWNKASGSEDGDYQLRLDLSRAALDKLNFYRHGTSILSFNADGFVNDLKGGGINGDIQVNDIMIQDDNGLHRVGNMLIAAIMKEKDNSVTLNSSVIDGHYYGSAEPRQFLRDFRNMVLRKEVPAIFGEQEDTWSGNTYDVDLKIHDSQELLSFFVPGLYVADSTNATIGISDTGRFTGKIRSGRLAIKDKYLKGVRIDLSNDDDMLNAEITSSELSFSPVLTKDNRILAYAKDNQLGLGFSYDNQTELDNKGEIFLTCGLDRCENDSLDVRGSILQSNIYLNSTAWTINPSTLDVESGHIKVKNFLLSSDTQSIGVHGGFSKAYRDTLDVNLSQFSIAALNPFLGNRFDICGLATGTATLKSPSKEGLALQADIRVDSTMISGRQAGTIKIGSSWNEDMGGFNFTVWNNIAGNRSLAAVGVFRPEGKQIDGTIELDGFDLGYAEPVLEGVFSEFGGKLTGDIKASGPLALMNIRSDGLRIDEGLARVDFTNVAYSLEGPLHIDNNGITFEQDILTDRYGEKGTISGGIGWNQFKDMRFNTAISFSDMEVLDLPESLGQSFYGHAFGSGQVNITGPMNAMVLEVNASTRKQGDFHIPMSGSATGSNSDLLVFKEPQVEYIIDPYEVMMGKISEDKKKAKNDMRILLRLNVDQGTQALVEIDKASGNILSGRGTGNLEIDVRPSRDIFNMVGNYDLSDGNYHLDVLGIAQKDFAIQEGSNVRFSGNIMDSDLDINATYRTKASIGTLIADTTSTARRTVECGISISDKIRNPQIGFSISVPDIDPTTQAMVENALNTDDKVQKQFLSLLISGSFLPDEQSGIVNNSSMLNTTVTELMAGQLNNILQKLDIPVDLGLDFQQGNNGKSIYDVAISTELFNNKVVVNGTIGNRQYSSSGTSNDEVVGDLDIEIKMDRTGALRFNLFSHSADQYTSYLDDSQRNGAGLTYQREFNSLKEFIKDIFRSKEDRKATEAVRQQELLNAEKTVIRIEE